MWMLVNDGVTIKYKLNSIGYFNNDNLYVKISYCTIWIYLIE